MTDQEYMRRAIALARLGEGWAHPNPLVGAVIVKDGRIIGEGYHHKCGELHAEREAVRSLRESAEGATIYVTLEPCCHYGRTPPCTEAILENKIKRVVIGSRDPNPKVHGRGAAMLREHGVIVEEDFLRQECDELNPIFFHYITTRTPYVIMKYAMTADGKIAAKTGDAKWITGEIARGYVQQMRHRCMGIMAGIGTVLADDPMLNCRIENGRDPVRIVCDSHLQLPLNSRLVKTASEVPTIAVCAFSELSAGELLPDDIECPETQAGRFVPEEYPTLRSDKWRNSPKADTIGGLLRKGIRILNAPGSDGRTDLSLLMKLLGMQEIDSILLEGGGTLNESMLRAGIPREVNAFIAPKLFGGQAKTPVEGIGVEHPGEAVMMELLESQMMGEDILLRYVIRQNPVSVQNAEQEAGLPSDKKQ
ncbi:MAG: bifunctional diaminohydroxyphosphoribosylaminopyrimidine deaminase/5-amino-6-(5-phosphoribosylamino)uracil reductase RibD [Lachnospiraceae bacterium]|nr:bifunctional diaminohydroxyphosphoribosylaminopyrimidine deaminase/5-amino-6-(5-phosphoribosylamino)uracil reductase RibD [Lachnospiraceae bacterium]